MTIMFDDKLLSLFYVELADGLGNFMAGISTEGMTYRFRYYQGDQSLHFEKSQDVSHWYEVKGPSAEELEQAMHKMLAVGPFKGLEIQSIHRGPNETTDHFMERFKKLSFVRMEWRTKQ